VRPVRFLDQNGQLTADAGPAGAAPIPSSCAAAIVGGDWGISLGRNPPVCLLALQPTTVLVSVQPHPAMVARSDPGRHRPRTSADNPVPSYDADRLASTSSSSTPAR